MDVIDPAFDRCVEFGERDLARAVLGPSRPQSTGKVDDVPRLDAPLLGVNYEAQPGYAVGLRFMEIQNLNTKGQRV
jgi:hypothetical protein